MEDKNSLLDEGIKLSNLITYQEGSVVSREIISRTNGTVTIFAFDKEQGLSEHSAPFDALVYIVEGNAEITIGKKLFNLKEAEMIIMPKDVPHSLKTKEKLKMLLIMIKE